MTNDKPLFKQGESTPPLSSRGSGVRSRVRVAGGERLFVEVHGRGVDVVLLHGAAMAPAYLRPLAELLSPHFRVLLVHRPGYGQSDAVLPYDADVCVERIEQALLQHEVHRPFLIGASLGAAQCMAMAVRGRIDPRGLVMLGAPSYGSDARRAARAMARMLRANGDIRGALAGRMLSLRHADEWRAVAEVRSWLGATRAQDLADELVAVADDPRDYRAEIAVLGVPTLIRIGTDDRMASAELIASTQTLLRTAELQEVRGAGHGLLLEDLPATAASVQAFLLRHTRGTLLL